MKKTWKRRSDRRYDISRSSERTTSISYSKVPAGSSRLIPPPESKYVHPTAQLDDWLRFAFQIFIADLEEVESLPRPATMAHLEKISSNACMVYLEHIIVALGEAGSDFHEKLIELYLNLVRLPESTADAEKPGQSFHSDPSSRTDEVSSAKRRRLQQTTGLSGIVDIVSSGSYSRSPTVGGYVRGPSIAARSTWTTRGSFANLRLSTRRSCNG